MGDVEMGIVMRRGTTPSHVVSPPPGGSRK